MTYTPLFIFFLAVALFGLLIFIPARPVFLAQIEPGTARFGRGSEGDELLFVCTEAAEQCPEIRGKILGTRQDGELRSCFSSAPSKAMLQRVTTGCDTRLTPCRTKS